MRNAQPQKGKEDRILSEQELRVEDVLADSLRAEMEDKAEAYREKICEHLEYLADEIRSGDFDPQCVVVAVIQPDVPVVRMLGEVSWPMLKEAISILGDAFRTRLKDGDVYGALVAGWARRRKAEWKAERDKVAKELKFPYRCDFCTYRAQSKAGLKRHVDTQTRHGCECGMTRCTPGGMTVYGGTDDNLGRYICAGCLAKARATQ